MNTCIPPEITEKLKRIEFSVRACGKALLGAKQDKMDIKNKGSAANIVTKYDKLTQDALQRDLLGIFPGAAFIGEEEDLHTGILKNGYTFIVDPIDGTANFARGLCESAISVGLLRDGEQYAAVCYNPYKDEMFTAQKGEGAYLNGEPIKVSDKALSEGLLIFGSSPYSEQLRRKTIDVLRNFVDNVGDYRRCGSSVIDVCNIACGRAEAFFELILQPWDYAASSLVLKEAGGVVTTVSGEPIRFDKPVSVLASNGREDCLRFFDGIEV